MDNANTAQPSGPLPPRYIPTAANPSPRASARAIEGAPTPPPPPQSAPAAAPRKATPRPDETAAFPLLTPPTQEPPRTTGLSRASQIVIAAIIILLAAGGGYALYRHYHKTTESAQTNVPAAPAATTPGAVNGAAIASPPDHNALGSAAPEPTAGSRAFSAPKTGVPLSAAAALAALATGLAYAILKRSTLRRSARNH